MLKKGSITIAVIIFALIIGAGYFAATKKQQKSNVINFGQPTVTVVPTVTASSSAAISVENQEETIRRFFQLINDQKAGEAANMMSLTAAKDDTARQTWGVNFNLIKSVAIQSIEKTSEDFYRVDMKIELKTGDFQEGWYQGLNTRWIGLVKENGVYKLTGLATGP